MNISASALAEARDREGAAADDRSAQVDDALRQRKRLGYRNGLPLVPPSDVDTDVQLGDDVSALYEHYERGDGLLKPSAGTFLRELAESEWVSDASDVATETNSDTSDVEKALDLHGIEIVSNEDTEEGGADEGADAIELPSGERVPTAMLSDPPHTDKLLLAQLLSLGMGVSEIARYLSDQPAAENPDERDVRAAAEDANLLDGDVGGVDRGRTNTGAELPRDNGQ